MKKVWCIFEFRDLDGITFPIFSQTSQEYSSEEEALKSVEISLHYSNKYSVLEYIILPKYVKEKL